jgi:uncharacterized protein (DUF4213/DUF364 family)
MAYTRQRGNLTLLRYFISILINTLAKDCFEKTGTFSPEARHQPVNGPAMIIEQTVDLLKSRYGNILKKLVIEDVRIGPHLTAVRLSDNSTGTSATLADTYPFTPKSHRDYGDFTPLRIRGRKVTEILENTKKSFIVLSLKNAVLGAVSSGILSKGNYIIREECDPIQLLNFDRYQTITIVGAFQSYIRKISSTGNRLFVLELNEAALNEDQKKYYVPAGEFRNVLPASDIVIITGQTLVNGTIDELLSYINEGSKVIVTGPSVSIIPDVLFENKVSMIGAVRITKPEALFDIISEGGTGYHLFEYCAKKICILKGDDI